MVSGSYGAGTTVNSNTTNILCGWWMVLIQVMSSDVEVGWDVTQNCMCVFEPIREENISCV